MRRFSFHAVIIGGFFLLTLILTYPLIFHLTTHIPVHKDWHPSGSEHWMWLWAFWFVEHHILELRQWSLFTNTIFYPHGLDLTNTMILGFGHTLALAIPLVRYLGTILPFNLFLIGSFVLTGYFTFLLVRYLTNDCRAAFIAGVIFAFSPYQMARAISMFGLATGTLWIPLYILVFIKAARGGLTQDLVLASLILTISLLSHPYYSVFLGIFSVIYGFYYTIFDRGRVEPGKLLRRLLAIGGITAFFCLPLAWVILAHWSNDLQIEAPLSAEFGADLLAFFLPSTHHTFWGDTVKSIYYNHFTGNDIEQTIYIGYTILLLSLVAIIKVTKAETRFWSFSAIVFFLLSLGPLLHIDGKTLSEILGIPFIIPFPSILLHFFPLLAGVRAYSRFSVMFMLALVVLVAYGTRYLFIRFDSKVTSALLCLGLIGAVMGFEFSTVPLPLADARIPKIYDRIATSGEPGGTLLDVPLYWFITKYEYYQTVHQKRLLSGLVPRIPLLFNQAYADKVPFVRLFRYPGLIKESEQVPLDRRDILRFIEFFDLSFIVIHKALLGTGPFDHLLGFANLSPDVVRQQQPEVFDRLMRFLLAHFPVSWVEEEGDIVVLKLDREHQVDDLWMGRDGYVLDFGSTRPQFFLAEGWSSPERWEELTVAWSDAKESRLWVYMPRVEALAMELKLLPFTFAGGLPQGMKIYLNGRLLKHIPLMPSEWHSYTVHLTDTDLRGGINTFRFVYDYTASPSKVLPGNGDSRQLAVAFDSITFRPER